MKKSKVILIHLIIWLLLSILYFLLSEKLTAWILPDFHDVIIWLRVLIIGLALIFLFTGLSLIINLKLRKKDLVTRHEKLDMILKYMSENLNEIPTRPTQIAENAGLKIESPEAHLMLDMMFKDGYVSKQNDKVFYEILYKGIIFLDNGGYTRENYVAKRQMLAKRVSDYVDIVVKPVGIVTALAITTWTIIQIAKALG